MGHRGDRVAVLALDQTLGRTPSLSRWQTQDSLDSPYCCCICWPTCVREEGSVNVHTCAPRSAGAVHLADPKSKGRVTARIWWPPKPTLPLHQLSQTLPLQVIQQPLALCFPYTVPGKSPPSPEVKCLTARPFYHTAPTRWTPHPSPAGF